MRAEPIHPKPPLVRGAWLSALLSAVRQPSTLVLLGAATLLAGCELSTHLQEAARKVGNPDPETVESGGRLIAEGSYRRLRFDGSTADDAFVVAIADGSELAIIPFQGGEKCVAGKARTFVESLSRTDDANAHLDARIPFLVPAEGDAPQTLRFTNFACELDELAIAGADLPLNRDFGPSPGVIVQRAAAGELLFVSPWQEEQRVIARNATPIFRGDLALFAEGLAGKPWMWTIEGGQLVARNDAFEEVFRAGDEIAAVVPGPADANGPLLALVDEDHNLLTVSAGAPEALAELANDVCGVQWNTGMFGRELLYFSPCEERHLRVHELETGTVRSIRPNLTDFRVAGATETGPILLYMTDPTGESNIGTLWARWGQNEPIRLGSNGNLRLSRLSSSGWVRVVVDWDGHGGTMLVGQLGSELSEVARGVSYYTSAGLIADFDGLNGTLYSLEQDREETLEKVTENIAAEGIKVDSQRERALFLSDFDGLEGQLTLVEGGRVRKMTKRVRRDSYQFTALLPMVTLLSDYDELTNSAVLRLHRTDRDDQLTIAEGVAETVEVAWPSEGLLYSAPAADPPGIYFARAL